MVENLDAKTLRALSTETRQEIVKLLSKRPHTASEISKILKKHVTTITEHLEVLEKSGLIKRKENGNKWVYYTLSNKGEKIFKPTYYTWVITLSAALVVMVFISLYQAFAPQMFAQTTADRMMGETFEAPVLPTSNIEIPLDIDESGDIFIDILEPETRNNRRFIPVKISVGKETRQGIGSATAGTPALNETIMKDKEVLTVNIVHRSENLVRIPIEIK